MQVLFWFLSVHVNLNLRSTAVMHLSEGQGAEEWRAEGKEGGVLEFRKASH